MAFHLDGCSESLLSSRVVSGSGGGDLLSVAWVDSRWLEAGVLPEDVDVDALGSSSTLTSSHEPGVGGRRDGVGEVTYGGVSLGITRQSDRSFRSSTVLGPSCLDDADNEPNCCQNG